MIAKKVAGFIVFGSSSLDRRVGFHSTHRLLNRRARLCPTRLALFILSFVLVLAIVSPAHAATTMVTYQVSAGTDDGFAWGATEQDIGAGNLMIGDGQDTSSPYQMSAMRFINVNIPRSAHIVDARLKIRSLGDGYRGQIYGVIRAEASDNAADFSSRYIASASLTAAGVDWDHKTNWSANTWYVSGDMSSVVQEVTDRLDWGSSNALAIYYLTRADSGKDRMFGSFEAGVGYAAELEITYEVYSISGHVTQSAGGALEGVHITAGSEIEATVTDVSGYYELNVPPGWSGTVTPSKADWEFSPATQTYSNVTADQINQDYTAFQPTISGYVRDSQGVGMNAVFLSADNGGGSDYTDSNGFYEIVVPYDWSGVVTPDKTGWGFSPASQAYSNVTADQINQDYTAFQPTISGYVRDSQGVGMNAVFLSADNGGGSNYTDSNGFYEIVVPYDWSGVVTPDKTGWGFRLHRSQWFL